jgi:hypothetical protein
MTPEEIAIMGSSLERFDFSKIDPSFLQGFRDYAASQKTPYVASQKTPAEKIYEELAGQAKNLGTEKNFQTGASGTKEGGLGSVDAVMQDMAKKLADAGLTSIEQFGQGQVPVYQTATTYPETRQGELLGYDFPNEEYVYEKIPTGRWLYQTVEDYGDSTQLSAPRLVPEEEVARLNLSGTQPKSVDIATGTKPGYINKKTGEPLTALTGYDGRGWSGTSAGDGQTIYNVRFDETTGLPIFFNQQKHGKDKYADLLKIAAIGTAIFAPQIGAALLPAGSSAAAALAVGSAVSGFIGSGGNLEAGIKAGLAGYLGGRAGSWASRTANSALVGNIASNMTRTAILGGNMEQALVASLVQAAPAEIIKHFPNFAELPRAAQEAAVAATVDLMRTGGDNLEQIAVQGATKGATDYALGQIDGYKDLRPAQQEIIRTRVSNTLGGASLSNELLQGAISYGQEAVQNEVNNEKAKKDGWADYATQQAAKSLYGDKVTPEIYADKQDTTEAEAKQIARDILGREPTEFEYMQLIGLPEREAAQNSDLLAIRYDESTFDSGELAESYKALYGKEPTPEWLASDEAMDMLRRSEAQGKNLLNEFYTKDKNETTKDEAIQFWKAAGFTDDPTPEQLNFLMGVNEATAETYAIQTNDIYETTFDGSGYDSKASAERAATAAGYNSYTWDGTDYGVPTTAETKAIEDKRYELTEGILKQQGTTIGKATEEQFLAALAKVDAVPTSYLKSATIQDVIKGTYSVVGADGKLQIEVSGANIVADSPASLVEKAKDQLPKGMTLASDAEVWGVGGERNPNVEFMVLPDGTTAYVKRDAGTQLPEQFIVAKRFDDLEANDPEAWLGLAAQFDEKQDGDLGTYLSGTANALMLGAYATGNEKFGDIVKQTLSITTQGVGEQVENLSTFFSDRLGMDHDTALAKAGAALQEWGAANQSKSTKDQEAAIINAVSEAKGVGDKIGAFVVAAKDNPGGLMTMIAKEGVQEILPLWAAKTAYRFGSLAAVSANTAIEAIESWGAGTKGTYEEAKKMGFSDEDARIMASKVGLQSAVITTFTNGFGDNPLVKRIIGDTVKDSAAGIAKAGGREAFTEYFDGLGSNAVQQYQLTGQVNWDQATTAATIGAGVGAGTSSGIMLGIAINSNSIVGRGIDGSNVTYADFLSGAKQVDMNTVSLNTQVGTDADGDAITLGNIAAMPVAAGLSYDVVKAGLPASITNTDVVLGTDALGNTVTLSSLMSGVTESQGFDTAYKNLLNITPEQRTEAKYDFVSNLFESMGYTPTAQEVNNLVAQNPAVSQIDKAEVSQYVDPLVVTEQEAKDAYAALGLNKPTEADILKIVGQYDQNDLTGKASENLDAARYNSLLQQIEQLGAQAGVDPAVLDAIKNDINSQITALGGDVSKLQSGVDSVVTEQAKTQAQITDLQNNLSEEIQAAKDIGLEGDAALQAGLDSLSEKMGVDQAALLTQLGTTAADLKTQFAADIATSQEATAEEIANTKTALETAIADAKAAGLEGDAALKAAIDAVAADQQTNAADLLTKLGTTEAGLKTEFEAGLAGVSAEVAVTRKALEDAIQAAQDIGLEGDAALQAGIDSVAADLGTTKEALLAQLGTTEETLRTEFASGITGLVTQMKEQYDALTTEQKALADALTAQGTTLADAIAAAKSETAGQISELEAATRAQYETLTAAQKAAADALVAQGQTLQDAITAAKTETAGQIAGVETRLTDAIAAAEAMGLSRDQAITAAVDSVAAELGTTRAELLTQLGTTEAALRTEFATGISGLEAQTKAQYDSLSAAQKATADALVAQGTTLADAITSAQEQTAGQIADVETRLTDAIAAAEAMGLSRDQAITAAVESVAADLGTTKDALLTQLGKTEETLRTEFTTGLAGVSAEVKAAYDSLTADQKALADQLAQQGVDLTTAIQTAQEQTAGQIGELTADVQAKYDALTAEQKALANQLQQQGVDLTTAIETAKTQTQQQITDLGVEVDARINELMLQGQTYQQATQQAFAEVNAKNQEMAGLIGTQGRTANQTDIDALTEMLGGQREVDLKYDVTGDKQITQADIDFLTRVIGGVKTDWTAPQESPWAATGLYGQIQANELRRQQDLAAAEAQRQADKRAAATQARQANIRTTATRAQTSAQGIMQQLEAMQRAGMAPQQPAQLVEAGPGFDLSDPLNTGFFSGFQAKKEQQNQQPTTKIAAGGYIDDLLAEDLSVDDLMNLLR